MGGLSRSGSRSLGFAAVITAVAAALLALPAVTTATVASAPKAAAQTALPSAYLIGDSTLLGIPQAALSAFDSAYDITFNPESCRRLAVQSCGRSFQPPNVLDVLRSERGHLGDAVVIMSGYDDVDIASAIEQIMTELANQGVPDVIWLTYRTGVQYTGPSRVSDDSTFVENNVELRAAATRWPSLHLADWDAYTQGHPEWFAVDGIHLRNDGGLVLARFIRSALDTANVGRCSVGPVTGTSVAPPAAAPVSAAAPAGLTAVDPERVLDTRSGDDPKPLGAQRALPVSLASAVPRGTTAAVVNVTADHTCGPGFLTAYPCGGQVPLASNQNVDLRRQTVAAGVTVRLDANRQFCVYASTTTHVVVDLFGWYVAGGSGYHQANPTCLADTRTNDTRLQPGKTLTVPVGPATGAGATAVALDVVAADPAAPGFLTVYPCDQDRPTVSSLNYLGAQTVANFVVVAPSPQGTVCVYSSNDTDVVVDATGWFSRSGGLRFTARTPQRLVDTRTTGGALAPQASVEVPLTGAAALVNVTAVDTDGPGWLAVRPCGTAPLVSNVNYLGGDDVPNSAIAVAGTGGKACVTTSNRADVVADLSGTFG